MESKLRQQKNAMTFLSKAKQIKTLPEKQNTWSNLLNKKSAENTNTIVVSNNKSRNHSPISIKTISKGIQCDSISTNANLRQSSDPLLVLNPISSLQYLLKEIKESPNIQNTSISKIVDKMQMVVERIINEQLENALISKSHMSVMNENDNTMIPTRDNGLYTNLYNGNNPLQNKYWFVLLEKISELENNYSQLTKNYSKSEEKLLCITSERDKLLEKFKESCDSLEILNNSERAYLDTITELKSKLMASEKLISKQEAIIINLNTKSNNLPKMNETVNKQHNEYKTALKEDNELKTIYNAKSNINKNKDNELPKLSSDMKEMKQIILTKLKNSNIKSGSMTSLKPERNLIKDFSNDSDNNIENDIDIQFTEYNKQASAIKLAKTELKQLFEMIETQASKSKKKFNSTKINFEKNIDDISDEEDNYSNVSNFMSITSNSSC